MLPLLRVSTLRILALLSVSNMLTAQLLAQRVYRKRERTELHPTDRCAKVIAHGALQGPTPAHVSAVFHPKILNK